MGATEQPLQDFLDDASRCPLRRRNLARRSLCLTSGPILRNGEAPCSLSVLWGEPCTVHCSLFLLFVLPRACWRLSRVGFGMDAAEPSGLGHLAIPALYSVLAGTC